MSVATLARARRPSHAMRGRATFEEERPRSVARSLAARYGAVVIFDAAPGPEMKIILARDLFGREFV